MRPFSMPIIQMTTCYFLELVLLIESPLTNQHWTHHFELQQQKYQNHLNFSQLVRFEWFPFVFFARAVATKFCIWTA